MQDFRSDMDGAYPVFEPATTQARLIRDGHLSPSELLDAYLVRIDTYDGELGSYVTVAEEAARVAAQEAERRLNEPHPPPFLGVPASIKDLNDTAGIRTTMGLVAYSDRVPATDEVVVRRMREAGFVLIGKTTTPALGLGPVSEPAGYRPARNPWNLARSAGGSSGGAAAALASGLCAISHGSDGGGSIRIPASWCGLVGLKPSRGRVSAAPRVTSMTATPGAIARNVLDAAAFLDVLAGHEAGDAFWATPPERPFAQEVGINAGRLRIAVSSGGREVAVDNAKALREIVTLLETLGHHIEEMNPDPSWACIIEESLPYLLGVSGLSAVIRSLPTRVGLDPLVEQLAAYTADLSAEEFVKTESALMERARLITIALQPFDVLICPTVAKPPPFVNQHRELGIPDLVTMWESYIPFTTMWNWTGHPAISIPVGLDREGLPLGIQLVGPPQGEVTILRLAAQLETVRPWADLRPPVAIGARV